ncbi:MAG: cytochrome D1 domain-containing protein [Aquificaceae bacterium]|uniref:cytochrome D1 domain-containing protein n=1 Tax=Hydrogenobacter sp. Uz 6-8 TaxID=3384828 RepID=UPI0030A745A3
MGKKVLLSGVLGAVALAGSAVVYAQNQKKEELPPPPPITKEEMEIAKQIYFDRCAGCHGTLRKGATGPALTPDKTRQLGTESLKVFITYGTPGGMPDWGRQGILNEKEIDILARFLQHDPPAPPELSLADLKKTWKVYVPPEKRPKKPEHNRNWQNFMGVILRDVGKVAIIDGDTKELVNIVDTGFAVHIIRYSASGRYMYTIGRDGKATMVDLWMKKPDTIAEVKACNDARSIDSSKYKGPKGDFLDKLAIIGCYWPPMMVILDGQTLEPLKLISTSSYTYDTNEFVREARVASIVASHYDPEWIVNIKETGQIWLVDYSNVKAPKITMIEAERFLHDGGWDASKRYFLVAANFRNKVSMVDTKEKKLVANIETGKIPHPGRGANFVHPQYGPVWCTGHLGDNTVACIGTDPKRKEYFAKVVAKAELPGEGGGNLFIKTHPKSENLWVDRPLNPDQKLQRSVTVLDRNTLKVKAQIEIPAEFQGRAVHPEYNRDGTEVWISVWGKKNEPEKQAILVYDDKTLKLKHVIRGNWVATPAGRFNVYNTMKDIY